MTFIKKPLAAAMLVSSFVVAPSAMALNIVLTNDDSWNTQNINNLKAALVAAGHDVVMSAPCGPQSGKGGSMTFMKAVPVETRDANGDTEYCVGETDDSKAFAEYVDGTPVMAALYGIDVAAQAKWGKNPDLVVSGPNEGNNLGFMNNNSGTLGAAMVSLSRGIPAIAVSGGMSTEHDDEQSKLAAEVVVNIIAQLEAARTEGQPLLPAYTGLNVNTPEDMKTNKGYKFTDVGWNSGGIGLKFSGDMSTNETLLGMMIQTMMSDYGMTQEEATAAAQQQMQAYKGKAGLVVDMGNDAGDSNENSEGVALQEGYITISTIDGNVQASRAKVALIEQRLKDLKK